MRRTPEHKIPRCERRVTVNIAIPTKTRPVCAICHLRTSQNIGVRRSAYTIAHEFAMSILSLILDHLFSCVHGIDENRVQPVTRRRASFPFADLFEFLPMNVSGVLFTSAAVLLHPECRRPGSVMGQVSCGARYHCFGLEANALPRLHSIAKPPINTACSNPRGLHTST
ncbi:hypothetical protein BD311DRAFT_116232 [Dichomitus squalens]|uniref:Uncharacterized protein n=1 Tax=Dichomitus squalens TaxID=114155 RepID=A0A4V2K147_9APHY|nr:hypothetical protein BD311DRAFT_116232 [Dichomitus squalens]